MKINDALEVIERLPYIRTIQAPNDKLLESLFEEAMAEEDCIERIKIIKTCYIRRRDTSDKARPLTKKMLEIERRAQQLFYTEIASALKIDEREVDAFIQKHLAENI
jgi:CarD family transcriptional regulator